MIPARNGVPEPTPIHDLGRPIRTDQVVVSLIVLLKGERGQERQPSFTG